MINNPVSKSTTPVHAVLVGAEAYFRAMARTTWRNPQALCAALASIGLPASALWPLWPKCSPSRLSKFFLQAANTQRLQQSCNRLVASNGGPCP